MVGRPARAGATIVEGVAAKAGPLTVERRRLGRTSREVPVIGMGTWRTFDVRGEEREIRAVVDAALDGGVGFFDSSPMYGAAEGVLGRALGGRRETVLVATKVWTPDDATAQAQMRFALDAFGGWVDLYQVHNLVAWDRRIRALERLRDVGAVRAIGATHYASSSFEELVRVMRTGRIDAVQVPLSPWERDAERTILPLAEELGIGVVVMRPFGEGALLRRPPPPAALQPLARHGITTWAQALLAWVLADPRVTVAIPATSSAAHVAENVAVGHAPRLEAEERALVERLAGT